MNALIVGVDSAIGSTLQKELMSHGCIVFGTTRRRDNVAKNLIYLDLMNLSNINFEPSIDVVFLCASITKLTECVEQPQSSELINVQAQIQLAKYFANKNIHIVYLSSNAVFNGKKSKYQIYDRTSPITLYGKQKTRVEQALLKISKNTTIVRLTKVLTKEYPLMIDWINALRKDETIQVFANLSVSPISVTTVAWCLREIAQRELKGIIHLSGEEDITYLDIANFFAQALNANKLLIEPKYVVESHRRVEHCPLYASLDISNSKMLFNNLDLSFKATLQSLYGNMF